MKKKSFLALLATALIALPVSLKAQRIFASIPAVPHKSVGINIGITIGAPAANYVWIDGYWDWDDYYNEYTWVPGTWAVPPHAGWVWMDGYWELGPRGYVWVSGYWANPQWQYSYYAATHRNGGGCAPHFVRDRYDRRSYTPIYVSGNRLYDRNYYYSGSYREANRYNYVGTYDRVRTENRASLHRYNSGGRYDNSSYRSESRSYDSYRGNSYQSSTYGGRTDRNSVYQQERNTYSGGRQSYGNRTDDRSRTSAYDNRSYQDGRSTSQRYGANSEVRQGGNVQRYERSNSGRNVEDRSSNHSSTQRNDTGGRTSSDGRRMESRR